MVTQNTASEHGGGICVQDWVRLSIAGTTISHNQARTGGLFYDRGIGGGVYASGDVALTVADSSIDHNQAVPGVGLYLRDAATISAASGVSMAKYAFDALWRGHVMPRSSRTHTQPLTRYGEGM